MPEKRLLTDVILTAYHEIVPDPSARAVFLMRKLAAVLYERGARIQIGAVAPPKSQVIYHSVDADQRIIWIDRRWREALGYKDAEVIGRPITEFLSEDSRRFHREWGWPAMMRDGKVGPVAITLIDAAGEELAATARSEALLDEGGRFIRTFARLKVFLPAVRKLATRIVAMLPFVCTFCIDRLAVI